MNDIKDYDDITPENVKIFTDVLLQWLAHDVMVDITDDLSGSSYLHDKHQLIKDEMANRNLSKLPELNGTISW